MADGSSQYVIRQPADQTDYTETRKSIARRLAMMREERQGYEAQYDELSRNFKPTRRPISSRNERRQRGQRFNKHLYDSTGVRAKDISRAGLMDGISSPVRSWVNLGFQNSQVENSPAVKDWLAEVKRRLLRVLAKSNTYNALAACYEEIITYGTCAMLILDDMEDVIRCYPLETGTYWLAGSNRQAIDTLYREFEYTVGQMVDEFGLENCDEQVQMNYQMGNLDNKRWILHAIEPNRKRVLGFDDNANMPYRSVYYDQSSPQNRVLRFSGYRTKPFIAWRWDLDAGDTYGYSPAMNGLPFIKALQFEQKQKAQGIAKQVNPPMVANPAMRNQPMSVLPGGVTFTGNMNQNGKGFEPAYQVQISLADLKADIEDVRNQVMGALYADLFMMISQLDDVRSATEIIARKEEKLMQLGPALQRAQDELLDPFIERVLEIFFAIPGFLPPAPQEIHGQHITIEYVSTLFAAQKAAETGNIERLLALVGNMAQPFPTVLDKINSDKVIDVYGEALSVPREIINTEDQANQIRQDREQQAANQERLATLDQLAKGAKVLSDTQVGGGRNAIEAVTGI